LRSGDVVWSGAHRSGEDRAHDEAKGDACTGHPHSDVLHPDIAPTVWGFPALASNFKKVIERPQREPRAITPHLHPLHYFDDAANAGLETEHEQSDRERPARSAIGFTKPTSLCRCSLQPCEPAQWPLAHPAPRGCQSLRNAQSYPSPGWRTSARIRPCVSEITPRRPSRLRQK
jgi:hypothetical protein